MTRLLKKTLLLCGLALSLCFPSRGENQPPKMAIWCEFLPYARVATYLPALARYNCDLILHVEQTDMGSPALAELCRAAQQQGVSVAAWFLLPYEEHLYVGEESLESIQRLAMDFSAWAVRENLGVSNLVFDCEPSPVLGKKLFEEVRRGRLLGLAQVMSAELDARRFQRSVDQLNGLIERLHERGFRAWGAGNRVFLDFMAEGNTGIQDALNAPFTMIHWDRISFITYRYQASQVDYIAMINRYSALAQRYFPGRAGLDMGLMGDHRRIPENARRAELFGGGEYFMSYLDGMKSALDLQEAVSAALARGVTHINLYSLDGAVESVAGLDLWLACVQNARPAEGLAAWTPVRSVKMGMTSHLLNHVYKWLVKPPKDS